MGFSLIHAGLAAGVALAAIPVLLHLFMKQQPKHVIFPALRLIRERQKRSKKKLRVKNWLLLLARMALLALMALALARPRIMSQSSLGDVDVPAAIALVFDTSLSMGYKERDQTRLDEAKARALEILAKIPSSSQVWVIDSSDPSTTPMSPATARKRVESMAVKPVNRALNGAIGTAYASVAESDRPRHEVYVLTDLARSSWDLDRPVEGLDKVKADKSNIKTYVLSLAPKDVHNVSIVEAGPTADLVTEGEPVEIRARVHSLGPATSGVAKLWLDGAVKGDKPIEIPANGEAEVSFLLPKIDASTVLHQGRILFNGTPDPLAFDDTRFFSFALKQASRILVVSDQAIDAEFISAAIDPETPSIAVARPFRTERIRTSEFAEHSSNLSKQYRTIFLNNIGGLSEEDWSKLRAFVARDGGGLVVGLGRRSDPQNYGSITAGQILPVSIDAVAAPKEGTTFGDILDRTHPLFSEYSNELDAMLSVVPVMKYWGTTPREGSRTLLNYADKSPALIERLFKGQRTGRVLLWTTPLSRRPESNSPDAWNEFPVSNGWAFFYLMNQTVNYLSGGMESSLNFASGGDVILPIDSSRRFKNYVVQGPVGKSSDPINPTSNTDSLAIVAPDLGQWNVIASGEDGKTETLGFSVNAPVEETRFVPLETADLEKLFGGKNGYALANDNNFDKVIRDVRVGRELFPWVMFAIMVVVTAESVLANRFYRESTPQPALSGA